MELDWTAFDDFLKAAPIDAPCCDNSDMQLVDNYLTCINCGKTTADDEVFVMDTYSKNGTYHMTQPYKRIVYLKQLLNYINCDVTYPPTPKLIYFIEMNKRCRIKNLRKLKKAMKRAKLSRYYKYIYSIFYGITGTRLIKLNQNEKYMIIRQFIRLEREFIRQYTKKNIFSYSLLIYYLMKFNNCPEYVNILLPYNKSRLKKTIGLLFDNRYKDLFM